MCGVVRKRAEQYHFRTSPHVSAVYVWTASLIWLFWKVRGGLENLEGKESVGAAPRHCMRKICDGDIAEIEQHKGAMRGAKGAIECR